MPSAEEQAKSVLQAVCKTPTESFMPSTEELVTAVRCGDKSAFAQLVRLYERAAIITAQAVLRDFHAAQDAAQEGFVIAYSKLDQLREAAAFGPWMLAIVRREALVVQRKTRVHAIDPETLATTTGRQSVWIKQYEEVVDQLARLPENERTVVVLRYIEGHSVQEIADTIGRPVGTVTKQLSRAMHRLRKWLLEVPS
jgi:RNA polymerase sigma-70 factor, ECF subfamily